MNCSQEEVQIAIIGQGAPFQLRIQSTVYQGT